MNLRVFVLRNFFFFADPSRHLLTSRFKVPRVSVLFIKNRLGVKFIGFSQSSQLVRRDRAPVFFLSLFPINSEVRRISRLVRVKMHERCTGRKGNSIKRIALIVTVYQRAPGCCAIGPRFRFGIVIYRNHAVNHGPN